MKKTAIIILMISVCLLSGCNAGKKQYLPEASGDKSFTSVGIGESQGKQEVHQGSGYTISVPKDRYRYEPDYDDRAVEEEWDLVKRDDVKIKVTTYKNTDGVTARGRFLRDNDDYIFEDLMGVSICGTERDGDTLWFRMHESGGNVYIVSWEYPKNTSDDLKQELSAIADTFKITEE